MTSLAATGHRWSTPRKPDGLDPADRPWIEERARAGLAWFTERGVTGFWTGMATGWDLVTAVEAIGLDIPVVAHIPYPNQTKWWPDDQVAEWEYVRAHAADEVIYGPEVFDRKTAARWLHTRNDGLLKADLLFGCWSGKRSGGTWSAIEKAQNLGLRGVHLDPATRRTRIVEPGGWFEQQEAPRLF